MMKIVLLIFSIITVNSAMTQIDWIPISSLSDSLRARPKPVFIFIHTTWCSYCEMMQHRVFQDEIIVDQLNQEYYSILLDAEKADTISFKDVVIFPERLPNGKIVNGLAKNIGMVEGKLAYPTSVFFDSQLNIQAQYPSYLKSDDFGTVLQTLTK